MDQPNKGEYSCWERTLIKQKGRRYSRITQLINDQLCWEWSKSEVEQEMDWGIIQFLFYQKEAEGGIIFEVIESKKYAIYDVQQWWRLSKGNL